MSHILAEVQPKGDFLQGISYDALEHRGWRKTLMIGEG
jgi:hypothetical protein